MCMYVCAHAWFMYLYMYELTSLCMQADRHEYVGMYICR